MCSFVADVQATVSLRILHVRAVKEGILVSAGCRNKNTTDPHQPGETTHFNATLPGKLYKGRSDHGGGATHADEVHKDHFGAGTTAGRQALVSWDDHIISC